MGRGGRRSIFVDGVNKSGRRSLMGSRDGGRIAGCRTCGVREHLCINGRQASRLKSVGGRTQVSMGIDLAPKPDARRRWRQA